mmetsp:Transcript_31731/g.72844  ORF Transcript_31731/g.72844 Transcript_31731/m.72844 type:complete len:357 (-) Transcript_31731:1874-2944(-)
MAPSNPACVESRRRRTLGFWTKKRSPTRQKRHTSRIHRYPIGGGLGGVVAHEKDVVRPGHPVVPLPLPELEHAPGPRELGHVAVQQHDVPLAHLEQPQGVLAVVHDAGPEAGALYEPGQVLGGPLGVVGDEAHQAGGVFGRGEGLGGVHGFPLNFLRLDVQLVQHFGFGPDFVAGGQRLEGLERDGFGQELVHPHLEPLVAVGLGGVGGDAHDVLAEIGPMEGLPGPVLLHAVEPVHDGHQKVAEDDVEQGLLEGVQALEPVAGEGDVEADAGEGAADGFADGEGVVDDDGFAGARVRGGGGLRGGGGGQRRGGGRRGGRDGRRCGAGGRRRESCERWRGFCGRRRGFRRGRRIFR